VRLFIWSIFDNSGQNFIYAPDGYYFYELVDDTRNSEWGNKSRTLHPDWWDKFNTTPQVLPALDAPKLGAETCYTKLATFWKTFFLEINGGNKQKRDFITRDNTCFFNFAPNNGADAWLHGRESVFCGSIPLGRKWFSFVAGKNIGNGWIEVLTYAPTDRPTIDDFINKPYLYDLLALVGHDKVTKQTEWGVPDLGDMWCPRVVNKPVYMPPHRVKYIGKSVDLNSI